MPSVESFSFLAAKVNAQRGRTVRGPASINRNVILTTAEALYQRLRRGGTVLFSGILEADEQLLIDRLSSHGFVHLDTRKREDWRAFVFTRN